MMIGKTNAIGGGVKKMGLPYIDYTFTDTFTINKSALSFPYCRYDVGGTLTVPIANNFCTIDDYIWSGNSHYTYYKQYLSDKSFLNLIKSLMSQINLDGLVDGTYNITIAFVDDAHIENNNPKFDLLADLNFKTIIKITGGKIVSFSSGYIICKSDLSGSGRLYLTTFTKQPN